MLKPQWWLNCGGMAKRATDAVRHPHLMSVPHGQHMHRTHCTARAPHMHLHHTSPHVHAHVHVHVPRVHVRHGDLKTTALSLNSEPNPHPSH